MRRRSLPLFGLVGIMALALMVGAGLSAGRINGLFGKREIVVELAHAAGLKTGDPVRISGVKVGTVKDLALADEVVAVSLEVDDGVELGGATRAALKVETLLGTEYIALRGVLTYNFNDHKLVPRGPAGGHQVPVPGRADGEGIGVQVSGQHSIAHRLDHAVEQGGIVTIGGRPQAQQVRTSRQRPHRSPLTGSPYRCA